MKSRLLKFISIIFLLALSSNFYGCGYNTLVSMEEEVSSTWSG